MQTISITVDPDVAGRIKEQVLEGFRALPKRGVEVGGILFGRIVDGAVRVDDFESVPCEHRYGPAFVLSEQDRAALEEILTRRRPEVVGYFRSCTGRELGLDASDEELISAHFRASQQVCLCIAPVSARACAASVFSWSDGQPPRQTDPVFLFDALTAEPPPPQQPSLIEPPMLALPAEPGPSRAWPWVFVLLLAIGCAFLYERWQTARTEWPTHLGLDVRPAQEGLELRWDASAPAVRRAGGGVLSITSDGNQNEIELDAAAVHGGSFAYKDAGKDILFRLTVYDPAMRPATESFRIVSVAQPDPEPEPPPEPAKPEPAAPPADQEAPVAVTVPPVAIHEVQPGISDGIRARIEKPVVVAVDVEINASGKVASAVPQSGGDALYRYLAERAASAALSWRFQPARSKKGTPVPSSKTIYFIFRG